MRDALWNKAQRGVLAVLFLALLNPALRAQDYVITQAPLGFTSISATGVNQGANFSNKDDGHLNIPIPFNFQFFGDNISAGTNMLRLGANGAVSFQTTVTIGFTSSDLNSSSAPNNSIFLAWDDLDFTTSGSIFTALQGTAPNRVWIIEYSMVPPYTGPQNTGSQTFLDGQIAIFETSNIIELRYSSSTRFGNFTVASGIKSSTDVSRGFPNIDRGQPTPTSNLAFTPINVFDLALSNLVVTTPLTPGQVTVGDSITISVDINNRFGTNLSNVPVNVYLSLDSTINTNDQLLGSFGSGINVSPRTVTNFSRSFTLPLPNIATPTGNYFIGLIADPANTISEVTKQNNQVSTPLTINFVDLALSNFVVPTPTGFIGFNGDSVTVSVAISNLSTLVNSTNFPVNVYLSLDSTIDTNDQLIGAFSGGAQINAGSMMTLSQSFTIPTPSIPSSNGHYFIGVIADPLNTQFEINRANNSAGTAIIVQAQDYVITQAPLGFTSISMTGTNHTLSFSDTDEGEFNIPVPFSFKFFGDNIVAGTNMLRLGVNGAASFQTGIDIPDTSQSLNSSFAPNNTIFLAWDDFRLRSSSSIFTAVQGSAPRRIWIIEYSMVLPDNIFSLSLLDGQIAIFETSNIIEFRYSSSNRFGNSTVASGLKSRTGLARGFPGIVRGQPTPTSNVVFTPNVNRVDIALSNLVITTPLTLGQAIAGDTITVAVDIRNLSLTLANSTSFPVNVYLSLDSTIDTNDQPIGSFTGGAQINAGSLVTLSQTFTIPFPNIVAPGLNYFIGLIADPANTQVEANTTNNRVSSTLSIEPGSFPDLALSNLVVNTPATPGQAAVGENITVSVDISNLSALANSTSFPVNVYLSLDSTIDTNDQPIGSFTGGAQINAGSLVTLSQTFTIPFPNIVAPGLNYFIGLIADPANTQVEANTTNNRVSSTLSIDPGSFPDLALSNLVVNTPTTPGQAAVGENITVSVDINNLSTLANSTSFPVNVYLSLDSTIDTNDQPIGSFTGGAQINAGSLVTLSQTFTIPFPNIVAPGLNYFIGLIADPANTQVEANTTNNRVSSPLSIDPGSFPDLALSNLVVNTPATPGQAAVGENITVSVDISNLSALANSTSFPVNVYLSLDSTIDTNDQPIGSFTGGAQINAGSLVTLSQSFTIPTPSIPSSNGHYFIGVIADPLNAQFDSNLSNNSAGIGILVGAQFFTVNLTLSNLQVMTPQRPGNARAGDGISISVDISNPFFVDSTNFPVHVYLSLDSTIDTNDQLIGSFTGGAQVNANGTVSLRESFILPTPNPSATSHRYRIGVIADPANTQADQNLSNNNVASTPFLIDSPYSVTSQNRGAFPTILGNANTVTLGDGATMVMNDGELLRPGGAPFAFPFFGDMIAPGTPVSIGFNGYLVIGSSGTSAGFENLPIPSNQAPDGFIAAFWDDLVSNTSGEDNTAGNLPKGKLSELVAGSAPFRTWTIEFTNFGRFQAKGTNLSFQIVIHESGAVDLRYDSNSTFLGTAIGFGATIGLENSVGTDGVDATGLGTGNLTFPSKDLALFPPGGLYSLTTQARGAFPTILGNANTVTLGDGATMVMNDGEFIRPGGAPFAFPFFGDMIAPGTPVNIGFNGYLVIGSGGTSAGFENLPIPSNQAPDGFIAAFWDDLVSNTSGEDNTAGNLPKGKLSELVAGSAPFRSWTIEFSNFGRFQSNGTNLSFQIVIHENGVINLRYDSNSTFVATASGFGATIGLENSAGNDGLDATGLGTGNLSFPSTDLFLSPPGAALPAPTPDLSPSSISLAQSSVSAGARIDVTRIITNSSSAAVTSSFQVSIYLSTDSTITSSDTLLGTDTIASLAAGTSASATSSFTVPSATPVGDYFVGIIVNNGPNPVTESNTTNNSLATSGTLRIDLPSKFRGDINGDNHVDISDLMACISVALAADSGSPANIALADVNGDNTVDILDIQFTINRILGAP